MNQSNEAAKFEILKRALDPDRICYLDETTKEGAISAVAALLATSPYIERKEDLVREVFKREELMSTGIGLGLAVPHVRLPSVREVVMAIGISRSGIADYPSLDDKPVHFIFLIAAPEGQHAQYVRLLSAISSRARKVIGRLLDCKSAREFYGLMVGPEGAGE